ncbi:hypothetical protein [Rosettibacter firmus]|uniref:hypothetical protein n=1 Tax=Rosettibacter firmus TaxID=3111522 RepID=UPI00336BFA46
MSRIYSQHIFLFPFTIELKEFKSKDSSQERLRKIHEKLKNSNWEYKPFQITLGADKPENFPYSDDEIWAYNEYNYFYDYIRDALYTKEKLEELFTKSYAHVSLYYERKTSPTDEITYYIKDQTPIIYTLKVNNVSLRIFETGIGILSLTLYNTCYKSFEDILKINDFGRRIYPQFLGAGGLKSPVDATKEAFLCDKIVFNACGLNITEEFNTSEFLKDTHKYANYIEELLKPLNPQDCKAIIDDRMYTICWYENDQLIKNLGYYVKEKVYNYERSREWYMFLFVDGKFAGIGNDEMRSNLIKKSTYPRFIDDGTIYGITRYSFMCLCGVDPYNDFPYKNIRNHMQKQYYQMAVLLLAQRASIIQFNNEIEKLVFSLKNTGHKRKEDYGFNEKEFNNILEYVKKLEELDIKVMNFINRMTYNEITPQEQGIELYNMALENMQIPNQLNILKSKINDLHLTADQILERMDLQEERERNKIQRERKKLLDKITLIAAIFTPLTLYSTLSKFIKPYLIIPEYFKWGIIPAIYSNLWSLIFLITLFLLTYCLINDDYPESLGYKINWFSPLKALMQQFFFWRTNTEIYKWKILLSGFTLLLIILTLLPFIELIKKLIFN